MWRFTPKNKITFLCTVNANALLYGNAHENLVYSHIYTQTVTLLMVFLISSVDGTLLYFCGN